MSIEPWQLISEEKVFEKYGRSVVCRKFQMPDGSISDFYVKKEKDVVCAVALTPDNRVIMTRQFRPGPNKVILDLPGGVVDKPNTPQEAISKELLEETGYQGKVELAGALLLDGYATQTQYCFVIKECIKQSEQQLEEDEYIEIELLSLDTFYKYLRGGQLSDVGGGYMALDYLGYL